MASSSMDMKRISECEEILSTISPSTMKCKAASVQHLLQSNAQLMDGIRSIQSTGDTDKMPSIPVMVSQIETNLLEVIRIYKDL
mmetsp:Transcript_63780/g.112666  ORF Transcript_63780/g.112666 Transcript_63780/m.112666 type:complete len:84 (+) Transcript_63780:101-352(+)